MPLYDFKCLKCDKEFEYACRINDRETVKCQCGGKTKQIITKFPGQDWFHPFISEDFTGEPILVKSKGHYKELCKQHGVYAPHVFGKGWNISEI